MQKKQARGVLAAVGAFVIWGATPLYWEPLSHVPAGELIVHRVWWAFVLLWIVALWRRRSNIRTELRRMIPSRRVAAAAAGTGILVVSNWMVYVWAITHGKTLDASLGYYVTPLMNVLLGTVLLREHLNKALWAAIVFAAGGVVYMTITLGALPWVSLLLALTFGFYGYIKKLIPLAAADSLAVELTPVALPAAAVIVAREIAGAGALVGVSPWTTLMLIGAGAVTVVPLVLFGYAAKLIRLTDVGFLQYIAPTMMLVIGVLVFGEPLNMDRLPGFVLVWAGLGVYTADVVRSSHDKRKRNRRR